MAPVLVTAYNRPEHLRACLAALASAGAVNVLLSIDGPAPGQEERVQRTRAVAEAGLAAFPDAELRVESRHHGCAGGVTGAIDWAFERTAALIVVEDDIVVSGEFVQFASLLLARLGADARIGSIGGMSLVPPAHLARPDAPARTSVLPTSWGWATWADRWQAFRTAPRSPLRIPAPLDTWAGRRYWAGTLRDVDAGRLDSWAYPWLWAHWQHGWQAVLPCAPLVLNRGFGADATHTHGTMPAELRRRFEVPSGFIGAVSEQSDIEADSRADEWMRDHILHADPAHLWYARLRRRWRSRQ